MIAKSVFLTLFTLGALAGSSVGQHIHVGFGDGGLHVEATFGDHRRSGHWEVREVRVFVPGQRRVVHVPAEYGWRLDACGHRVRFVVRAAYDRVIEEPGRWEVRRQRVWVEHGHRVHHHHGHGHDHGRHDRGAQRRTGVVLHRRGSRR